MKAQGYTFTKQERLTNKILLEKLFSEGSSFKAYPFRVIYAPLDIKNSIYPAQFAVSIPKKRIKKSPLRNKLKRRTREAYRLAKAPLYEHLTKNKKRLGIFFIYLDNEPLSYKEIELAVNNCIEKIINS